MNQFVNTNLVTLKCVLFCFLSGVGCIYPFLPLHMLSVGLEKGEARLISAIAPCIALLGPALLGPLIDKLSVGRGSTGGNAAPSGSGRLLRLVTATCFILSALFCTLLLAVPYTERHEGRRPQVLFMCDQDSAYVMQEVCKENMRCNRWPGEKTGVLAVGACEYGCYNDSLEWMKQPFITTSTTTTLRPMYSSVFNGSTTTTTTTPEFTTVLEEIDFTTTLSPNGTEDEEQPSQYIGFETNPPHICYKGQCLVYMNHMDRMRLPLTLIAPEPLEDNSTADSDWCTYRTSGRSQCLVPEERLDDIVKQESECKPAVRCQVLDPYDEPDGVLADAECRMIVGDPTSTFWSYLIIRILTDIWPTAALALLGTACVIATRETSLGRGDVGRQLAFGTIGLAIFPPLAGLAADSMPDNPFLVPFILHAVFMIIGALMLILDSKMPLSTPEWWWHTATGVLTMPMNVVRRYGAETAAVFAVVVLLGTLCNGIDAYLPWMVTKFNGTYTEVGVTLTIGALPAVPALWWAEALVDYIGHSHVFIMAFTFYGLRYTGLAYADSYGWVAGLEALEVVTMSLVWVTAVLYFRHLVPRKYTASGQALPVIAHFCIGRCIGAIVSGLVTFDVAISTDGRAVYEALAVCAILSAGIYLALYHFLLAPKCASPAVKPPQHLLEGLNTNGSSNGHYAPMRVYHEERSRKGHFRY